MSKYDPKNCDLKFVNGTVYKDLRELGGNAYRDIKMSLTLGTSSDLVYYLKPYSKLLKNLQGDETIELLSKGSFSCVYLVEDGYGKEVVVKRSHDGWVPLQLGKYFYIHLPRWVIGMFISDFGISAKTLKRDVYDYEKILTPFFGKKRIKFEDKEFTPYLNMALHMVDSFLPEFKVKSIYSSKFWSKLLDKNLHKMLPKLKSYLKNTETAKLLIPKEERYILFDAFSNSLQTIFIQEAMRGKEDIIPGKKMAFPFELIAAGIIPKEMPKVMIEHILRTIESFIKQLDYKKKMPKVPDYRPIQSWKVFPPTAYELFFAETNNLVVYMQDDNKINISLVDTHLLMEPESYLIYRWIEIRYWISLFLNLRFWVRKALEFA